MKLRRPAQATTITALLGLFAAGSTAYSQAPRPMTLIDAAELPRIAGVGPQLSPDGKTLAYALTRTDWKAGRLIYQLWRQDVAGGPGHRVARRLQQPAAGDAVSH